MRKQNATVSRRGFLGVTAATAAAAIVPARLWGQAGLAKPNSKVNGVQIGAITYSYRELKTGHSAEQTLDYLLKSGLSSVELMDGPINGFIKRPSFGGKDNPEANDKWLAASEDKEIMARCAALRKMYADAGVTIHTAKFGNIGDGNMTDGEIEFCLKAAKALGAVSITREVDTRQNDENVAKRLGPLADKHKVYIGLHNHEQINAKTFDGPILSFGEYIAINLDIGHYTAANDDSVVEIVEKYNKRIVSLHVKDRKNKANGRANMPFGEGNTPIVEVLQLMRKNKYTFPADIELEYKIPDGSDSVQEVAKCVQYCKKALA